MAQATAVRQEQDLDHQQQLEQLINATNIADDLDAELLSRIGQRVYKEYEIDVNSRAEWVDKTKQAMELAMQVAQQKQFPWPKASNVIFPLMTTAAIQFAARAYPAIIQNRNVVKGIVVGSDTGVPATGPQGQPILQQGPNGAPIPMWLQPPGAKRVRADNIADHMSWQLLDEMPEWEPETDTLLHVLPIVGCEFRKSYFDPSKGRNCSLRVPALNLVINYHAKSVETAPRLSEEMKYYPNEVEEKFRAELWKRPEHPFGQPKDAQDGDESAPWEFIEQHRWWDLDDDGYEEPYIVTVHKESRQVVRIVARYDAEGVQFSDRTHEVVRIDPVHYYTKYDFLPNPDGGIYGIGFGQLLRPLNEAVNTTLNQLIDAGTLQNTGGGFIGKGLSMNAGSIKFQMGEYKVVQTSGASVRENIVPLNFPGPSPVLFQLLGQLIEAGREVSSIKDILTGEQANPNTPATTTLAIIEQGLKVFTAIYKRIHRSLKAELNKLYRLNRVYGKELTEYKIGEEWRQIQRQDYVKGSGVEPISDPTMISDMQRLGRAQFLMQFWSDPYFNGYTVRKRILEAASIDKIDEVLNQQPAPNPAVAAKGMELEINAQKAAAETQERRAHEMMMYAQGINFLAQADKAVAEPHLQWLSQQILVWQKQFEAANTAPQGAGSPQMQGGAPAAPTPPALPHPTMPPPAQMPNSAPTINPHNPGASLAG